MRCSQIEKHLAEYVDDLLAAPRRERVEAHLAGCEACRRAVRDIRAAVGALRSLPLVRPPDTFAPRVRSAVRAQAPRALAPPLLNRDLRATLSGVCLMVGLGLLVTRYTQPRPYVAPRAPASAETAPAVTLAHATPASRHTGAEAPRPARPAAHPTVRPARYVPGTVRALSAISAPAPSRERLLPKPTAERPTVAPASPAVSRPAVHLAALADPGAGPRLVEEAAEAPRLVVLPPAEVPAAAVPVALTTPVGAVADSAVSSRPSATGGADAVFGFGDLFREDSLPRYADVS